MVAIHSLKWANLKIFMPYCIFTEYLFLSQEIQLYGRQGFVILPSLIKNTIIKFRIISCSTVYPSWIHTSGISY